MNIWYFNHYASFPGIGKFSRAHHLGRAWTRGGHVTTVFVARWHHQLGTEIQESETTVDGVRYVALKARRYRGNGIGRIFNMMDYCVAMTRLGTRHDIAKPDLIIVSSPHPFAVVPALRLATRTGAKLVFEVRDLWPLSIVEVNGTSPWHPFVLLCGYVERLAYRRSDLAASLLGGAEPYMRSRGLAPGKFVHVPNGIDTTGTPGLTSDVGRQAAALIDVWHGQGRIVVIHPGAQGVPNALDRLVDAIAMLNSQAYEHRLGVLLVGEGGRTPALKEQVRDLGLENVAFFPPVPKTDALYLTSQSDIGYAGGRFLGSLYRYGTSFNKVVDFMHLGLPVVLPFTAEHDPAHAAGCGVAVENDSAAAIAEALMKLADSAPEIRKDLGRRGQVYVNENLTYETIARRYLDAVAGA
jgi:glycosyltransferase involved in cell wall biosynthesis